MLGPNVLVLPSLLETGYDKGLGCPSKAFITVSQ